MKEYAQAKANAMNKINDLVLLGEIDPITSH